MRFLATAFFGVYTVAAAASTISAVADLVTLGTTAAWAALGYALLKFAVFATFAVLVAVRGESDRRNRDRLAIASCVAAFGSLAFLRPPSIDDGGIALVAGDLIAFVGMLWTFVALLSLGRCFGVLPEARGLVTRGPYRLVRHPVYLGELAACYGLTLAAPGIRNAVCALVFTGAQAMRTRLEERALGDRFPEYASYAASTPRFLARPRRRRDSFRAPITAES
jgi:protein-S-isoprenylcysteine O-methyltransferase Ste14